MPHPALAPTGRLLPPSADEKQGALRWIIPTKGCLFTRRLVEALGGAIRCESTPGRGSTFIGTFAFRIGTAAALPQPGEAPPQPMGRGKRVLLVEDNALNREISRELLESEGFAVEEADDGDVAVEKVRRSQPGDYDLILMDVQMPRLNGFDATRQIRALADRRLAAIPVLAVTANAVEEDRAAALAAGMNGHIAKPIDRQALHAQLCGCMAGQTPDASKAGENEEA